MQHAEKGEPGKRGEKDLKVPGSARVYLVKEENMDGKNGAKVSDASKCKKHVKKRGEDVSNPGGGGPSERSWEDHEE